jgi:hypothetical protein
VLRDQRDHVDQECSRGRHTAGNLTHMRVVHTGDQDGVDLDRGTQSRNLRNAFKLIVDQALRRRDAVSRRC